MLLMNFSKAFPLALLPIIVVTNIWFSAARITNFYILFRGYFFKFMRMLQLDSKKERAQYGA
jgi:hypothetical protein